MRCAVCNAGDAKSCSTCESIAYCSAECKKDDERIHGILCEDLPAFLAKFPRPIPKATLAIFFSRGTYLSRDSSKKKPEFIWMEFLHNKLMRVEKDGLTGALIRTDVLKGEFHPEPSSETFRIYRDCSKMGDIEYPLCLYMRNDGWMRDGTFTSFPNICLLETTQGDQKQLWLGPLLIYSDFSPRGSRLRDITMNDFRIFMDFCKVYQGTGIGVRMSIHLKRDMLLEIEAYNPSLFESLLDNYGGSPKIKGVEITCEADAEELGCEKFIAVETPPFHPIFNDYTIEPAEITKLIELPLLVRQVYHMPWKQKTIWQAAIKNPEVEALYVNVGVCYTWGLKYFGEIPICGRYLVIREDRKNITPHQVEAVVAFCKCEIYPKMSSERRRLIGKTKEQKREAREIFLSDNVSRIKFEEFFSKFKSDKVQSGDDSWQNECSPYEVQDIAESLGQLELND